MSSLNKAILIGNVGKDPEIRYTADGKGVANFSLATSERWTDGSGQKQEKTEWHNVVAWGKLSDICQKYVQKGKQLCIEGKIITRKWEDKDGNTRHTPEIVAHNIVLLGSGSRDSQPEDSFPD